MTLYRAFLLADDDSILAFQLMECLNDQAALAEAAAIKSVGGQVEVWEAARRVGRVAPSSSGRGRPSQLVTNRLEPGFLADVLEAIDQPVAIYDDRDKLVSFNRCYAARRSAIGGDVVVGASWDDLVAASVAAGAIPEAVGRERTWLERRRQLRGAYSVIRRLPDGSCYRINERRMPGGVVVVWTDLTEFVHSNCLVNGAAGAARACRRLCFDPGGR